MGFEGGQIQTSIYVAGESPWPIAPEEWEARAAETLTPVSLELGGKDPMVVIADADVERAANHAVYYSMLNGGQTCVSVERLQELNPELDPQALLSGQKINLRE